MTERAVFHMRNVLLLLGIIITTVGVIYFATEFGFELSEWGRVLSLALLATVFVALGRHFETTEGGTEIVQAHGWRWLRVTTSLYLLGLVATFSGVIVFLGLDVLPTWVKAGSAVVVGLAIILITARRFEA